MKYARRILIASIALSSVFQAAFSSATAPQGGDFGEVDELRQTYTLSPGASVRVNDIAGPVEITTWEGTTAEVNVVRSARSRADLEHKKIIVEHTSAALSVFTEPRPSGRGDRVQVRQRVTLKLPRQVSLKVNDIAGKVLIGEVDGDLHVNDVAGSLEVTGVSGSPRINDIAGAVKISVGELGAAGLRINDIAGRVELVVAANTNADLNITDISGRIGVEAQNATPADKSDREKYHGKIGNGGPAIVITDIAGSVTVRN
jgi:DUF4097 and DUF4098 domain-containing protein YvlB